MHDPFDPLLDRSPRARLRRLALAVVNSRFFLVALIVHLMIFIWMAMVIIPRPLPKEDFVSESIFPPKITDPKNEPPVHKPPTEVEVDVKKFEPGAIPKPEITLAGGPTSVAPDIFKPTIGVDKPSPVPAPKAPGGPSPRPSVGGPIDPRVGKFVKETKTDYVFNPDIKKVRATFRCYVAQYQEGDWDCNLGVLADGHWYGNCIANLSSKIQDWSQGKVKAQLQPVALKISDNAWMQNKPPPFIFITGHKNFHFTEAEGANLREYLMLGGALWVDNSLPGQRSRFDEALRREMKKILPDREFEPLGIEHPVYHTFFDFKETPKGMNFYKESVEAIKINGEVAVVYTLNAYSDLWETALNRKDQPDMELDWSPTMQANYSRTGPHFDRGSQQSYHFFRNVNQKSIVDAYKLGVNVVYHLITRYELKARDFHPADSL